MKDGHMTPTGSEYLRADNVDICWARNKNPCVIVNECFIFITHSLFPVRISKGIERRLGDMGGGGWLVVSVLFVVMALIEELEVLIVKLFVDLFVGLFVEEKWV
nr:hypothetical protein [Tanacetum cinerariifolium]